MLIALISWALTTGVHGVDLRPALQHGAMVAAGEAMNDEGYTLVLCVMRNRREQWGHQTFTPLTGWYAPPRHISEARRLIAEQVFSGDYDCPPWLFVLSKQDVQRMGLRPGDYVIRYTRTYENHYYEISPWNPPRIPID